MTQENHEAELREQLARSLKDWRRVRGVAQEDVGVSPFTVVMLEAGRTTPRPSTLRKIASSLGISIEELWRGPDMSPKEGAPSMIPTGQNENDRLFELIGIHTDHAVELRHYAEELLKRREDSGRLRQDIQERRSIGTERRMLARDMIATRDEFRRLESELDEDSLAAADHRTLILVEREIRSAFEACMRVFEHAEALENRELREVGEEPETGAVELNTWRLKRAAEAS